MADADGSDSSPERVKCARSELRDAGYDDAVNGLLLRPISEYLSV